MERITQKDLEYLVKRINEATKSPETTWSNRVWNIGNYHLDYAYSGVKLVRTCNDGGGITEISRTGFGTKRELYNWMNAFLTGLDYKD